MLSIDAAHWAIALLPVLALLLVFDRLDALKLVSLFELGGLLILGGIAALLAWPISGRLLDTLPIGFSNYSRFVAPWDEEALKGLMVLALFWFNRVGYKVDAVIIGFAIGAGFSVIENILYLVRFPYYGTGTWLVRGLGTAIMHGTTLALLAAIAHEFAERKMRAAAGDFHFNLLWFVPGYLAAVAIHTAFNQFPDRPLLAMMGVIVVAPLTMLAIFQFGTAEAEHWLVEESATHQKMLEALSEGRWPAVEAAKKIVAFAERLGPAAAQRIRRYWEVQTWLVLQSEERLIDEESGKDSFDRAPIEAALAELRELRLKLGRTTEHTLKRLLPFSRNDYWEVFELRQRLRHRQRS
jgi:protease PrsW